MRRSWHASGLLLVSGAAALICETVWVKQLSRVVGVKVHAVTSALSAFFAGLAIGAAVFGPLAAPSLERRVVAELLPAVVRAVPQFAGNLQLQSRQEIQIRIGDGRHELLRRAGRYDLITLEPPPPSAAGVANLAQWWPLPAQNDEDSRSLVRSFLDVFPYATVWTTELHEMLLIGSMSPLIIDTERVAARFSRPDTAAALSRVGIESTAALLATWITDRRGLESFAGDAAPVTDDRPILEHAAWVRRGEFDRVLGTCPLEPIEVP